MSRCITGSVEDQKALAFVNKGHRLWKRIDIASCDELAARNGPLLIAES